MARHGQVFKNHAVARLLPTGSAAVTLVAQEVGESVSTLERWQADALSKPARERAWPEATQFQKRNSPRARDFGLAYPLDNRSLKPMWQHQPQMTLVLGAKRIPLAPHMPTESS